MAIETIDLTSWNTPASLTLQQKAIAALEAGKIVFMPGLTFKLFEHEHMFLDPEICDPKRKNVSYDINTDNISGIKNGIDPEIKALMRRYALASKDIIDNLFPHYTKSIKQARTSYRPVEIAGRKAPSYRKDDSLLHVDAFPSAPTQGKRILRVFSNVNPHNQPRIWRVGEPFANVVQKFAPQVKEPVPGSAWMQSLLGITRSYRTRYDHFMLYMHNIMKGDAHYQQHVAQQEVHFPPNSSWIVYTDQVSHAAMSGQYVFEQTFYLPVDGLQNKDTSPLKILEKYCAMDLI